MAGSETEGGTKKGDADEEEAFGDGAGEKGRGGANGCSRVDHTKTGRSGPTTARGSAGDEATDLDGTAEAVRRSDRLLADFAGDALPLVLAAPATAADAT